MKKYIALIVSLLLLCSAIFVSAYEDHTGDSEMSEDVMAILREQMDASELEVLKNKDYYWYNVPDDFAEYPMMRAYIGSLWETADWSLQEIEEYNETYNQKKYMVFYQGRWISPILVNNFSGEISIAQSQSTANAEVWGEDLKNITRYMNLGGVDCKILEIGMIDGGAHQGKILRLITDKGNFVVYYGPRDVQGVPPGILWTEEEFCTYAAVFEAYLVEHAYGPNGEPTGGTALMLPFLKAKYSDVQLVPFDVMQARRNVEESPEPNQFPYVAVAVGVLAVVVAGAVAVVILRKKRAAQ